jgi:hypothetical protein
MVEKNVLIHSWTNRLLRMFRWQKQKHKKHDNYVVLPFVWVGFY